MNIREAAERAGTSVRTLRYYEEVGLIAPDRAEENNYREYSEEAVKRLRLIRAYRELQFSVEQIRGLLAASSRERDVLLEEHVEKLREQRKRIDNRIAIAETLRMIGPERLGEIDFSRLDEQIEQAQRFLDENEEMRALSEKFKRLSKEQEERMAKGLVERLAAVASEEDVPAAIEALRDWIEENFYPCTDQLLTVYARAFGGDGLLAREIDAVAGDGASGRLRQRMDRYLEEK